MRPLTSRHVSDHHGSALFFATLLVAAMALKPLPLSDLECLGQRACWLVFGAQASAHDR